MTHSKCDTRCVCVCVNCNCNIVNAVIIKVFNKQMYLKYISLETRLFEQDHEQCVSIENYQKASLYLHTTKFSLRLSKKVKQKRKIIIYINGLLFRLN